jgi:hypothetical protein
MIHLGLSKPTINNQKPYKIEQWKAHKARHTLDKILFYVCKHYITKEGSDEYKKNESIDHKNSNDDETKAKCMVR